MKNNENMNNKIERILDWAAERGLNKANPIHQFAKLAEECGELAGALIRQRSDDIIDAIGDIQVVLIILCEQLGLELGDCLDAAYLTIKNRRGEMVEGVFIKEEDLQS